MNSIKSGITVLFLLGMSYGVYTLVNNPELASKQGNPFANGENPESSESLLGGAPMPRNFDQADADRLQASSLAGSPSGFSQPPVRNFDNDAPDLMAMERSRNNTAPANPPMGSAGFASNSASNHGEGRVDPVSHTHPPELGGNHSMERIDDRGDTLVPVRRPGAATAGAGQNRLGDSDLVGLWPKIDGWIRQGDVRQPLRELSRFYNADLSPEKRREVLEWLDALAFKVIYSTEHHLAPAPYLVQSGDTLESIAAQWNVPPALVYNVNQSKIGASAVVSPGIELKKIQGPFRAEVHLQRQEITLFLSDMYAGRFPVRLGSDITLRQGDFQVQNVSTTGQAYQGAMGQQIEVGHPNNPYGQFWMGLGGGLCIHSMASEQSNDSRGCISVRQADANDIFGILGRQSRVSIVR